MQEKSSYRTHPVYRFPWLSLGVGHQALANALGNLLDAREQPALVLIDGFVGIEWESFITRLRAAFTDCEISACWLSTESCLYPSEQIQAYLAPTLTNDPVFGQLFRGHLEDLWDQQSSEHLRQAIATRTELTIVYGYGASLLAEDGIHVYADVPKDRGQELAAKGQVLNVGACKSGAFGLTYKRLYFVDWPMLNRIKRALLPQLDLFVDATESTHPRFMDGASFRHALQALAHQPFRVKPWFAPGPWGGQWMKEQYGSGARCFGSSTLRELFPHPLRLSGHHERDQSLLPGPSAPGLYSQRVWRTIHPG